MCKTLCFFFIILFFGISFTPSVIAWKWSTHQDIVTGAYYFLDEPLRETLDLEAMQEGAIAPDKEFKDFRWHSYPASYTQAMLWLEKAQEAYDLGSYNDSSYYFGVASHYISDSFSSPHNIAGESSSLHGRYEKQAQFYDIPVECSEIPLQLETTLAGAVTTGDDWETWITTKDTLVVREHLQRAFHAVFNTAQQFYDSACVVRDVPYATVTTFVSVRRMTTFKIIILGVVSGLIVLTLCSLLTK